MFLNCVYTCTCYFFHNTLRLLCVLNRHFCFYNKQKDIELTQLQSEIDQLKRKMESSEEDMV